MTSGMLANHRIQSVQSDSLSDGLRRDEGARKRLSSQTVTAAHPANPPHINDSHSFKGANTTLFGVGTATAVVVEELIPAGIFYSRAGKSHRCTSYRV
jgi:hypothetical protein